MSAETQINVDTLLLEFREFLVSIDEERLELIEKLREFPEPITVDSPTLLSHNRTTVVKSSSSNTNSNTANSGSTSEPPSEDPNSNSTALSSSIATTTNGSSTRPPSYKTAINKSTDDNNQQQVPRPPLRLKKRSSLPTQSQQPQVSSIVSAATAALARLNRFSTISPRSMSSHPSAAVTRGALIVLEGLDRVGKSTLVKKLVEHLQNISRPVATCRFPDRTTKVGQLIDDLLKNSTKPVDDHVMHLLFSANRWEFSKTIRNTLMKGTTVVVDRYAYSGMAYSSAKRTLSMEWCRNTELGLPKPDLVIYLELPKEFQYLRPGFGEERFETREFQEQIRLQYEQVIKSSRENWLRIDVAHKSPDEVLGEIVVPVKNCLESSANKELEELD